MRRLGVRDRPLDIGRRALGEGEAERVGQVWRCHAARLHLVLTFDFDLAIRQDRITGQAKLGHEPLVVGYPYVAPLEPLSGVEPQLIAQATVTVLHAWRFRDIDPNNW